ncbi:MAG TPA: LamG domain-containing protein [Archangium sp.]|nr:LamG domain-containing protein [Archangium sp.]
MIRLSLMTMCLILITPSLGRGEPTNEIRGLLMRFDEPIGMRFTDYSGSGHTITPVGGVSHSRTERIAGAGSACFDGTGYLRLEASPDFHFQGDLTIDFWFKSTSTMRQHALSFGSLTYPQTNLDFNFADTDIAAPTGPVGFWLYWNSSGSNMIVSGTRLQYMDGNWHHVAMVRINGQITAYVDGAVVGNVFDNQALGSPVQPVFIGSFDSTAQKWTGCIDELRIINGRALWTSSFNPRLYLAPPLNAFR